MILANFVLLTDRGDKLRLYVEPLVGMVVSDLAGGGEYVVKTVNRSRRLMTLLAPDETEREADHSKDGWVLMPGKNGDLRLAA